MYATVPSVLLVEGDAAFGTPLAEYARARGCAVEVASTGRQANRMMKALSPDLMLIDLALPDGNALNLLKQMTKERLKQVVVLTSHPNSDAAEQARRYPILDYMAIPLAERRLDALLDLAAIHAATQARCSEGSRRCGELLSQASVMTQVFAMIRRVAPLRHTVLVHGESGTGKELAARALHRYSRRTGKFVALNCGALSGELAGSQLFGHERGSFTGAVADHTGVFEQAHRGTLFLDEITEMPAQIQASLLRILEDREVVRIGAKTARSLDVRVIVASNRNPQEAVRQGMLRADLYYRLAEFTVFVPPLRERNGDIDLLAQHFVEQINRQHVANCQLSPESLIRLNAHTWPGNVRELRHVIGRAYVLAEGAMLEASPEMRTTARDSCAVIQPGQTLEDIERRAIMLTLDHFGSDRTRAAQALGISVKTIYNKLARYRAGDASHVT